MSSYETLILLALWLYDQLDMSYIIDELHNWFD